MGLLVIDFVPPILGVEGDFNTFRLGLFYAKRLQINQSVLLMDSKEKLIVGAAVVVAVYQGSLKDMLGQYSATNHAMLKEPEEARAELLGHLLRKFYGPHIATYNRKTTVIELRRVYDSTEFRKFNTVR